MIRKDVNANDKRVIKTKKAIRNAFTELLSKYDINEITITDIARVADVNRKTIYNYYNGVYEILDEVENECLENYEKIIAGLPASPNYEDLYRIFDAVTGILVKNIEFYENLIKINNNSKIVHKIYQTIIERLREDLKSTHLIKESKVDVAAEYITTGMVSAYIYWFNSTRETPLEDFAKDVSTLVLQGLSGFAEK